MKVKLAVGTIGIRGTDFETTVDPDSSGEIKLFSGELEITESKTGKRFPLRAPQKVSFELKTGFSGPEPLNLPTGVGK
jgi:hypothetical protein